MNVALEALQRSFDVRIDGLQWVVNVYTLSYAVLLLSAGALSDRLGSRKTFVLGSIIFTLSSLSCGVAESFSVLLVSRIIQGVGAALLVPSSMALLQRAFPDAKARARAVGLWAGAGSLALVGGPVLGGALIASVGWRGIFLINLPIGLLGIWLTLQHAPQSEQSEKRGLDLTGQIVAALALTCLVGSVTQASTFGWGNLWIIGGVIAGAMLFGGFLAVEALSRHPMMPLGLFRNRTFSIATFVGVVANFVFYGLVFVLSLFFQVVQGRSAFETGLAFLPMTGVIMFINVAAGRLIGQLGIKPVLSAGLGIASAGYFAMLLIDANTSIAVITPIFVAAGVGIALTVPCIMTAALAGTAAGQAGIAAGALNSARQCGGAAGVALFGSIIGMSGAGGFVSGMRVSIALAGTALLLALLITLILMPAQGSNVPASSQKR